MTGEQLLPCPVPWCADPRPQMAQRGGHLFFVRCNECGTQAPYEHTEAAAFATWNTRLAATPTALPAAEDALREELSAESYGRDFIAHGERSTFKLEAWERAYQDAGLIEAAERAGYIRIGSDVRCTIELQPVGRTIAALLDRAIAAETALQSPRASDEVLP